MSNQNVQKIGILLDGFIHLAGARDFIVSCVDALNRTKMNREIVLILRVPRSGNGPLDRLAYSRGREDLSIRGNEMLEPLRQAGLPDLPVAFCRKSDRQLQSVCEAEWVDVVGPLTRIPDPALRTPWFGYLYDFQHKYLPELFSADELSKRDDYFESFLTHATSIIVNSRDVRQDVRRHYQGNETKVIPLPFSASPKLDWFSAEDTAVVQERYGIGRRFFLISNQFWLHKNHETALKAFAKLHKIAPDVSLVMTGDTNDHRSPTRLQDIEALIESLGITDSTHILGLIPKLDQISLMRGAIAVVQPTSFEGGPGGGSVFDGIALGVRTIVSDIPVNREIESLVTRFFKLNDVEDLFRAMSDTLSETCPDPSAQETLLEAGAERRVKMGRAVWRAAKKAIEP